MAGFAVPTIGRHQFVLFPDVLDDCIPKDHPLRLLDEILDQMDWTAWERSYVLTRGQPPIHPKILAGLILYGIQKRIRSSRELEEAILTRSDFRWLAQGQTVDHTTLCKFRHRHSELIKSLYAEVALVARSLGHLSLKTLGYDGTTLRANNRRSGSKSIDKLHAIKRQLELQFMEIEKELALADQHEDRLYGAKNKARLNEELSDVERRAKKIATALKAVESLKKSNQPVPQRIPTTDPESRIMKNKEGGFAPNYTPTVTVDVDSGIIVDANVLSIPKEDKQMIPSVQNVMASFGLEKAPEQLLADGLMNTGENLAQCEELGIDFYSPVKLSCSSGNPAVRQDLSQPVADADIAKLPVEKRKSKEGVSSKQFHKSAFVYDSSRNSYWCPAGKELRYVGTNRTFRPGSVEVRERYLSDATECQACPLKALCIRGKTTSRILSHGPHEQLHIAQSKKMAQESSKKKYSRRSQACERPFAVIKERFGARRFLTRGLEKVQQEWSWLVSAFNLQQLMSLLTRTTGPPSVAQAS